MLAVILQARVSSRRLPGKVLKPILGEPMLARQIERIRLCRKVDKLVVATSDHTDDDPIQRVADRAQVSCHRGSLENVLERFHGAAVSVKADHVVRMTGDCPLIDPGITDRILEAYQAAGCDYMSNCHPPTLPDGLDVEVFSFETLDRAFRKATKNYDKEHVTPYIHQHPDEFRLKNWSHDPDLSHLRWTVDEAEDYEFVRQVYEALYPGNPAFGLAEIQAYLEKTPDIQLLNRHFERNAGAKIPQEMKDSVKNPHRPDAGSTSKGESP